MPHHRNGGDGGKPPEAGPDPLPANFPALPEGASDALRGALGTVAALGGTDIALAPRQPTAGMLAAGARAGGIAAQDAERVWRAMLGAVD